MLLQFSTAEQMHARSINPYFWWFTSSSLSLSLFFSLALFLIFSLPSFAFNQNKSEFGENGKRKFLSNEICRRTSRELQSDMRIHFSNTQRTIRDISNFFSFVFHISIYTHMWAHDPYIRIIAIILVLNDPRMNYAISWGDEVFEVHPTTNILPYYYIVVIVG